MTRVIIDPVVMTRVIVTLVVVAGMIVALVVVARVVMVLVIMAGVIMAGVVMYRDRVVPRCSALAAAAGGVNTGSRLAEATDLLFDFREIGRRR